MTEENQKVPGQTTPVEAADSKTDQKNPATPVAPTEKVKTNEKSSDEGKDKAVPTSQTVAPAEPPSEGQTRTIHGKTYEVTLEGGHRLRQ